MEQTFITIHNLSHDANILFASESIVDILGYQPQDVHGKSCFDYFHPDEVLTARSIHNRSVLLDKAAVLHYVRILSNDGRWVSCECCFTIVHNILVACTSIYRQGRKSERRAIEAPRIRRIFSCSPRDPRYHMLEHLSPKFKIPPTEREPRAALILNRFTRTLSVMYATNTVSSILGAEPDEIRGKSIYDCIAGNCWRDAIRCLESAKANDSIVYLRFWSRDPLVEVDERDVEMADQAVEASENSLGSGMRPDDAIDISTCDGLPSLIKREVTSSPPIEWPAAADELGTQHMLSATPGDQAQIANTRNSQRPAALQGQQGRHHTERPACELEAVVFCTSDGLVMVIRKARPPIPSLHTPTPTPPSNSDNGSLAVSWSGHHFRQNHPVDSLYTFHPPPLPHEISVWEHVKAVSTQ